MSTSGGTPVHRRPDRWHARTLLFVILLGSVASCTTEQPIDGTPSTSATPVVPGSDEVDPDAAPDVPPATVGATTPEPPPSAPSATDPTPPATPAFELVPAGAPTGTVVHGDITFDGQQRTYRLYVPRDLPSGPVPLLIALHGGMGWGDQFAQTNHVEGLAESNGFIVVHPDGSKVAGGVGGVWNGGICCGVAARDGVDDVGFINQLIDELSAGQQIDPARVYAFGHSNGGIMSYRLACESADRIVGIGLYAGTLGVDACDPTLPVSVMHVHGTADTSLPLGGGVGPDSIAGVDFPAPREGFAEISTAMGCSEPATSTAGNVTTDRAEPCAGGAAAQFVTIDSANHAWPGGTPLRTPASGAGSSDYDATAQIVAFLLAHPRT